MIALLLKVTALCLAAMAAILAMRRTSAALRHLVGASAIAGILILPVSLLVPSSAAIPIGGVQFVVSAASNISSPARPFAGWIGTIWTAGAILFLFRLGMGHWKIRSIIRHSEPAGMALLADVSVPLAAGLLRPVILLPRAYSSWPLARQSAVLRHEQAHIDRLDLWINFIANVACAVYWFHPLAWALTRRLRQEQETACDDAVLAGGMEPACYAEALTAAARQFTSNSLPGCPMLNHQTLQGRIARLFDAELPRKTTAASIRRTTVVATALLTLLGAIQAQEDQQEDKQNAAKQEKIYRAGEGGVVSPSLLARIEPAYTDEARDAKLEGTAVLSALIDVDGKASGVLVTRPLDPGLDTNAVDVVKRWSFQPATLNGEPVPVRATIEIHFRLQ